MTTLAQDLGYLSITDAAAGLQGKQFTSVDITQALLDRIAALDSKFDSYITVTPEGALAQAKQADAELAAGTSRGPLHGVPIALKDLYPTKGIRTTGHSAVLKDWVPDFDCTATTKMAQAGSVLLGKLAMHEFAFGGPVFDTPFPPARNPWNTDHITGGSSSGSGAALAAGLCLGSLGSDTGGSIRGPASLCGIVGLKPTYGRVSRWGVLPLSWSLDHVGPMTRTVEDCALVLGAIAGYDAKDAACANVPVDDYLSGLKAGVKGLRLGVPRSWFSDGDGTDPETLAALEAALQVYQALGATIVEVDGKPFSDARAANTTILVAEAYAYHEQNLKTQPQNYGSGVRGRFRAGALISSADYIAALRARTTISAQVAAILGEVDAILSPTSPAPAPSFAEYNQDAMFKQPSYTNPYNLTGLPVISIPCGFSASGLPIGLQIATKPFTEALNLQIAYAYEQATDWHTMRPSF